MAVCEDLVKLIDAYIEGEPRSLKHGHLHYLHVSTISCAIGLSHSCLYMCGGLQKQCHLLLEPHMQKAEGRIIICQTRMILELFKNDLEMITSVSETPN